MQLPSELNHPQLAERKAAVAAFAVWAAEHGHVLTIKGVTMDDQAVCSCGWKSSPYWDGAAFARCDWGRHVAAKSGQGQVVMNF
jgi:hypothetical protein